MRIVLHKDRCSAKVMRKELTMLEVGKQVLMDVLIWIFKIEKDLLPNYLQKFIRKKVMYIDIIQGEQEIFIEIIGPRNSQ